MKRLLHKPLGVAALAWLLLVTAASVLAPVLAPFSPDDQDLDHVLSGPTGSHWLGTGTLGRDVLSRLLYGGQITLLGVLVSCAIYLAVGVPLGLVAGYVGGRVDRIVLRLADVVYSVPVIIVLLVVVAIFPGNETAAMVTLGLLGAPGLARIVRSITQGLRQELFVRAAQVSGLRPVTIMRRHILPRIAGTVVVQLSLFGAGAVLLETGLGFLGLGSKQATWGSLIAEASQNVGTQMWLLVPSGVIVISFILALGLLGDAVRDVMAEQYGEVRPATTRRRRGHRPVLPATTAPNSDALLSVRDLTVAFERDGVETPVVTGVGFDLRPGEALGIIGESGCGKSVTARSLFGLLPGNGRITAGSNTIEGQNLVHASTYELRAVRGGRIGWISQEPILSLDPSFTVGSQLVEAIRAHRRCTRREARARAVELLTLVRLPDPAGTAAKFPHQLSGGMAQRVGIAAALAADPAMLIADEPTTALDVTVQAEILDLLRELQQSGMAIILVTHDLGVLSDLCERGIVMYAGEIVEAAAVTELIRAPRHPYTAALLAANPHDARPGEPLRAIEGTVPAPADWPQSCRFANRCPLAVAQCRAAPVPLVQSGDRQVRCVRSKTVVTLLPSPQEVAR
ncbi:MAG: dipeptide/oligopeptide/nickel ABC transporter permease/ATP-binding protein [Jatrophihabitans sp.]|uniref:dipeptide/oligopeptide/nickel ABC transporter permease/ATP-binding protein n=1 Tax=Jatrophihabitans sp. TaxID=1932789 RepID=UPI003F80CFD0